MNLEESPLAPDQRPSTKLLGIRRLDTGLKMTSIKKKGEISSFAHIGGRVLKKYYLDIISILHKI